MKKIMEEIHFRLQPIVNISSGRTIGFEVLSALPSNFSVEEFFSGASKDFLFKVIRAQLSLRVDNQLSLFMNIPTKILLDTQLCNHISKLLAGKNVNLELQDPDNLLNIDEEAFYTLSKNMSLLKHNGASVWLDDVKEDMLILVSRMHFFGVKIDKSVLWKYRDKNYSILASFVGALKLCTEKVLVEGIETKADLHMATRVGLDYGQGFYWPEISLKKVG